MKKATVLLTCALLAGSALAQDAAPPADPHAADRAALLALAHTYEEAIAKGDGEALIAHLSEKCSITVVTGENIDSPAALRTHFDAVRKLLAGGHHQITLHPEPALFSGDIAICHGTADEVATLGSGRTFAFKSSFTAVLKHEGAEWKLVRLQTGMDPVRNCFVEYFTKTAVRTTALFAGVIAGMIGGGVGFWWGRRKGKTPRPA